MTPLPRCRTLLLPFVAALALAASSPVAADSLDDAYALMAAVEATTIELQVDATPLEDVVDILGALLDVPVHADWEALHGDLTLERDDRISLNLRRAPGSVILDGVELELAKIYGRPRFEYDGGRIVLTTRKGAAAFTETDAYDLRALLADEHALAELRRAAEFAAPTPPPAETPDEPAEDVEDADESTDAEPAPESPGRVFVNLLMRHVAPDEWIAYGGHAAEISERNGVVVVTAPATIHRRLHDTVERLRALTPLTVNLDVALITLSRDDWRALEQRRNPRDKIFARRLKRDDRATVVWSTRMRGVFDRPISVDAVAPGDRHIRFESTPRWDPRKHVVNLDLSFDQKTAAGDQRTLSTTIALPADGDVMLLDLPGLDPETVAVLVVDTTGR